MAYWLMKSEPDAFSIDDLRQRPGGCEPWDGVRNYQARNMMRDDMRVGDRAFFYHSNCKEPGIAGIMKIVRAGYPDSAAANPESKYFDPKHSVEQPRWHRVDVEFERKFKRVITLDELKRYPTLEDFVLLRRGTRLSVMPVTKEQWVFILGLT